MIIKARESIVKIQKLVLKHYKRLQLNQISEFTFIPKETIQIIIGTNGSGKSSVMAELSPLPPDPKDYLKEGSKQIWLTDNGSSFELTSTFGKKDHHSFKKDSEELNPGGTVTVQLDLVKKFFRLTPEIFKLALGKTVFSSMKFGERREWFMQLADSDYDYVIKLYHKTKERYNDIGGALRLAKKRVVTETAKILPAAEIEALRDETNHLHEVLNTMLEYRKPVELDIGQLEANRQELYKKLNALGSQLVKKIQAVSKDKGLTKEVVQDEIDKYKAKIKVSSLLSTQFFTEHQEISRSFDSLEKTHTQNIANIDVEITKLEKEQIDLLSKRVLQLNVQEQPEQVKTALETVKEWLSNILPTLPTNPDKHYSKASMDALLLKQETTRLELSKIDKQIQDKTNLLNHYNSFKVGSETTCPNCKHTWIKNYDPTAVKNLETQLEALGVEKINFTNEMQAIEKGIEEIREYFKNYKEYIRVTQNWPILTDFWEHVNLSQYIFTAPQQILQQLESYTIDIHYEIKIHEIEKKINELKSLISLSEQTAGMDFNTVKIRKEEIEKKIEQNQVDHQESLTQLNQFNRILSDFNNIDVLKENIEKLLIESKSNLDNSIETMRRDAYNSAIRQIQSVLARKEQVLRESDNQLRIIQDIENNIVNMENQDRCLKILLKELSPTEGIIAEGLFGFMKLFIRQMNNLIKRIWSYPLIVQPCSVEDSQKLDLTYRFPVMVNTPDNIRDDISKGSSAMLEVVDLAFRINAMKALHLREFPLYLDEFGHSMDPSHKASTITLINSIMEQEAFTQLFMISHDVVQYGALSNTEICVICPDNINLPKDCVYNRHVTIV